jgi:hypothetical protein
MKSARRPFDRVRAHERMAHRRILRALALGEESGPNLIPRPREVVNDHEGLDPPLRRLRQRRVATAHAGELGGTALRRDDPRREQRAERRHGLERAVAVPQHVRELVDHPPIVLRDHFAGLDVEIRLAREWRSGGRIHATGDLQVSESPAERDLALVVERLPAKDQDRMLREGRADVGPRPLVERAGDIRAVNLRREHRGESGHDDLSHRRFPRSIGSRR